jgi:hypothetical protein
MLNPYTNGGKEKGKRSATRIKYGYMKANVMYISICAASSINLIIGMKGCLDENFLELGYCSTFVCIGQLVSNHGLI